MKQYVFHNFLNFFLSYPSDYLQGISKALIISNIEAKVHVNSYSSITLEDATKICKYFKISLDEVLGLNFETKKFRQFAFYYNMYSIKDFWEHLDHEMRLTREISKTKSIYLAADIPIFYLFRFPELTAFKLYYWATCAYHQSNLKEKKFDLDIFDLDLVKSGYKIWNNYARMDTTEIWGINVIDNLLNQVSQLLSENKISFKADLKFILEQCMQLLNEVEEQASNNQKSNFIVDSKYKDYNLYILNSTDIPNTLLFSQRADSKKVFQVYYTLDHLLIEDLNYCNNIEIWLKRFELNATPLCGPANFQVRENFFNGERRKITNFIAKHNL